MNAFIFDFWTCKSLIYYILYRIILWKMNATEAKRILYSEVPFFC